MKLARTLLALALLAGAFQARAEERTAVNSVFAEGLGPGLLYSLNYERTLENDYALRVGFSYMSFSASATSGVGTIDTASVGWFSIPVVASYLGVASGNHALELGLGGIFTHASGSASGGGISATGEGNAVWGTAVVGYRRQPVNGGFMFRVGLSALFGKGLGFDVNDPEKMGVVPWPYISLGATF